MTTDLSLTYHDLTRKEIGNLAERLKFIMDANKVLMALEALKLPSGFHYSFYAPYIDINANYALSEAEKIPTMEIIAGTLFKVFRCRWEWTDSGTLVTKIFGIGVRLWGFVHAECITVDDPDAAPTIPQKHLCGEKAILYKEQMEG